jgi:hypothetical protein
MTAHETENFNHLSLTNTNVEELTLSFTYDLGDEQDAERFCSKVEDLLEELEMEGFFVTFPDDSDEEIKWFVVDVVILCENIDEEKLVLLLSKIDEI